MASAPVAAAVPRSSAQLISDLVEVSTPAHAKKHTLEYIKELTQVCDQICVRAFTMIRDCVDSAEASRFTPVRTFTTTETVTYKWRALERSICKMFKEKFNLTIKLPNAVLKKREESQEPTEFESFVYNKENFASKESLYHSSIEFSWTEEDLEKIFPERSLFYSNYQPDPTPLEQALWETRETTASHTFVVGDRKAYAHRDLLIARSEYFKAKFTSGFDPKKEEEDVNADTLEHALHFFYKRRLPEGLTLPQLLDAHRAANKWTDDKMQQCVLKQLSQWREKNPLSKETIETYCDLALNSRESFGGRFKAISKTLKESICTFVEDHKQWEVFERLVTLDTITKWEKIAHANETRYPYLNECIRKRSMQLLKEARDEAKKQQRQASV